MENKCRSGPRCAGKTENGPALVAKDICAACIYDAERCLRELPFLGDALKVFIGRPWGAAHNSKVSSSPGRGVPIDVGVADLLAEIRVTGRYANARDLETDQIIDLRALHKRASDAVGLHPRREEKLAPCPQCSKKLFRWTGTELVECSECDMEMSLVEYRLWCYALTEGQK